MSETTMIERVARSLHDAHHKDDGAWEGCVPSYRVYWLNQARAAIKAMREPNDTMVRNGAAKIRHFTDFTGAYPRTRATFLAMIDAALSEGEYQ